MPRHPSFRFAELLLSTAVLAGAGAHAAELGDARVNSYLGQQLSADIELSSLRDAVATVQVRVASLDVYRGAGLEMPAVLSSVNLSVVRRDGKQFLHITSTRPIDADHLHLYLELTDGGQRGVRLATLWFTPDPAPPPAPRIVAAPVPAPPAVQEVAPARPARTVPAHQQKPVRPLPEPVRVAAKEAPKPAPAEEVKPDAVPTESTRPAPAAAKAALESKPAKAEVNDSKQAAPAEAKPVKSEPARREPARPSTGQAKPPVSPAAPDEPKPPPLAWAAAKAKQPPPAVIPVPKAAPACPKEAATAEHAACTGLDGKNAELRAELVKLESRVKTLQDQAQARAAAEARAAAAPKPVEIPKPVAPARPAKLVKGDAPERPAADEKFGQVIDEPPAPAPVFKPVKLKAVVPLPPKPEEQPEGMPWGWIAGAGAGVFALVGGLQFWRHRRKQATKVQKVHAPLPETDDEELIEPTLG